MRERIEERIVRRKGEDVFLPREFTDLSSYDHARWIHENQNLDASYAAGFARNRTDELDSANLVGTYYWRRKIGGTLGFFDLSGSEDPVYYGNFKGNSNSNWGLAEIDYVPWLNVKLGVTVHGLSEIQWRRVKL